MGSENTTPSDERGKHFEQTARLFKEHEAFIRSMIQFAITNPSEVDDFFQQLYLSIALNPQSEEIRNPRGFFYRVITERAVDWRRRTARRIRKHQYLGCDFDLDSGHKKAETIVSEQEEIRLLFDRIEAYLNENEARAILYRYKYDYTVEQTARKMGIQPRTVIRYVSMGLKKIRELFHEKERQQ